MAESGDLQIDVETLERLRRADPDAVVLDVREAWEVDLCALDGSLNIPLGDLPNRLTTVPNHRPLAILCHHGSRSLRATLWLRQMGYHRAINVAGGIDAWAAQIDPTMRRY